MRFLITVNPGPLVPSLWTTKQAIAYLGASVTVVLAIVFLVSVVVYAVNLSQLTKLQAVHGSAPTPHCVSVRRALNMTAFLALGAVFIGGFFVIQPRIEAADAAAPQPYPVQVSAWLAADYGIAMDRHAAQRLVDGEVLGVDYDGQEIAVVIVHRADGDLALRVADGPVLAPLP